MIPELLLEEILLGEKDERDYYDKYGKAELQSALASLRKSNEEILAMYPLDEASDDFSRKAIEAKNSKFPRLAKNNSIWRFSAAAALICALAGPLLIKNISPVQDTMNERVKGNGVNHHQIRLYRQSGNDASILKNGDSASENDLIQITYIPGEYNYGVIFSVDGNGNITRHFPEDSWSAAKLEKTGEEVPLPFSYSLDNAPDYECFVFVASKKSFDLSKVENISRKLYSIDFLKKGSYLPKNCDGSIFVLDKK